MGLEDTLDGKTFEGEEYLDVSGLGRVDLGSGLKKLRPSGNCEL